ncbi:tetratricopeptide repeat protein [Saccharothrix lopnurensis]|uniref:Tetratricopeptide repeat protein n=1 Tax=Saccharothrix lopnurensis TaxID=1670621 RepID=A0ABW1PG18_9PSEU
MTRGTPRQSAHAAERSSVTQAGRDIVTIHNTTPPPDLTRMVSVEPPWDRLDHDVRGRTSLVDHLARMTADGTGQLIVVHGGGGYGKTTLALHFAARMRERGVTVWWVPAHDESGVATGMREVCSRVGVSPEHIQAAWTGQTSAPDLLWRSLADLPHPWLLVVDNADDPELVVSTRSTRHTGPSWLRSTKGSNGSVLITSRDGRRQAWGPHASLLPVPALDPDHGARVLLDLTRRDAGQFAAARAVADRLGGLPLALRLAGLHSARMATAPPLPGLKPVRNFDDYLASLDEHFVNTVEAASPHPSERREPRELITETWELSLEALRQRGHTEARTVLRLLSCFAHSRIPYRLLDARVMATSPLFTGITPEKLLTLLQALAELGLTEQTRGPHQSPELQAADLVLHPVVRESNRHHRDVVDNLAEYAKVTGALLDSATRDLDHEDSTTWAQWQALAPHCTAPLRLWEEAGTEAPDHADHIRVAALSTFRCGRFLYQCGLYSQAEHELTAALEPQHKILGDTHPDTVRTRVTLASVLTTEAKFDAADTEFHTALTIQTKLLGHAHPDTLDTRSRRAVALRARDRLTEAEAEFRAVLNHQVTILGAEHRQTLDTKNRLAHLMHLQGKAEEAEAGFRAVLAAREIVLGRHHINTLDSRSELASLLHVRGDLADAEAEYHRLLADEREALGEDHPKTLIAYSHLAMLRHDQNKIDGLEQLYEEVLDKQKRVLGPTHIHTLATRHRLAKFHFENSRLETARQEFEDVLHEKTEILGEEHHATLITREYRALTLAALGNTQTAIEELKLLLTIRLRTTGKNHPLTSATRANLAAVSNRSDTNRKLDAEIL